MLHRKLRCDRGLFSGGPGPRAVCGTSHLTPVPGANPERTGSSGASPLFLSLSFSTPGCLFSPPFFSSKQRSADERPAPRETLPTAGGSPRGVPLLQRPRSCHEGFSLSDFAPGKSSSCPWPADAAPMALDACDRRRKHFAHTKHPAPRTAPPPPDTCAARVAHTHHCIAAARPHTSARRGTRAAVHAVSTAQRPSGPLPCGTLAHPSGRLCPPPSVPILTPLAAAAHSARPRRSRAARCSLLRRSPSACPLTSSSLRATLTLSATQLGSSWPWTRSSLRSLSGA